MGRGSIASQFGFEMMLMALFATERVARSLGWSGSRRSSSIVLSVCLVILFVCLSLPVHHF